MPNDKTMWDDIRIEVAAEFKKVKMTLGELKQISKGLVIDLGAVMNNEISLLVENKAVAKGELVIINDKYGVKITDVFASKKPETKEDVKPIAKEGVQAPPPAAANARPLPPNGMPRPIPPNGPNGAPPPRPIPARPQAARPAQGAAPNAAPPQRPIPPRPQAAMPNGAKPAPRPQAKPQAGAQDKNFDYSNFEE
ncbi:TPA: FliM/FliN family flagellar motor switch protein [Candidatus Galligastranaerophilus intestinigallinarum]|nr:FliM/FliN family flagellar motor switch protein [Candidatus Galligastranaerophilus intestinigallinarum]